MRIGKGVGRGARSAGGGASVGRRGRRPLLQGSPGARPREPHEGLRGAARRPAGGRRRGRDSRQQGPAGGPPDQAGCSGQDRRRTRRLLREGQGTLRAGHCRGPGSPGGEPGHRLENPGRCAAPDPHLARGTRRHDLSELVEERPGPPGGDGLSGRRPREGRTAPSDGRAPVPRRVSGLDRVAIGNRPRPRPQSVRQRRLHPATARHSARRPVLCRLDHLLPRPGPAEGLQAPPGRPIARGTPERRHHSLPVLPRPAGHGSCQVVRLSGLRSGATRTREV